MTDEYTAAEANHVGVIRFALRAGEHNGGNAAASFVERTQDFKTITAGHEKVKNQNIWMAALYQL